MASADGTIFLSNTVLSETKNEAELVGLLAHEATHVIDEHAGLMDSFQDYLKERGLESEASISDDDGTLEAESQVLADEAAVATSVNAGYDPCAFYCFANRIDADGIRLVMIREQISKSGGCNSVLFGPKRKNKFTSFKNEIERSIAHQKRAAR